MRGGRRKERGRRIREKGEGRIERGEGRRKRGKVRDERERGEGRMERGRGKGREELRRGRRKRGEGREIACGQGIRVKNRCVERNDLIPAFASYSMQCPYLQQNIITSEAECGVVSIPFHPHLCCHLRIIKHLPLSVSFSHIFPACTSAVAALLLISGHQTSPFKPLL